jgi:ribosomal-protein-alanine N-acetyltransferase
MSAAMQIFDPVIRAMTAADIESVIAIEKAAYQYPWAESIFRDCLRVGYCCRVIEGDGVIVGYALMSIGANEAHILNICVEPTLRRQGLGRRMLDHLIETALEQSVHTMYLEVRLSNHAARRLYDSMGFNEIGVRRAYYAGKNGREDAIVLGRVLFRRAAYT